MNVVIHSVGGRLEASLTDSQIDVNVVDDGPGIPDVEQAMVEGFSTASAEARALGFGAGMGLPNIRRNSDRLRVTSRVDEGTRVSFTVYLEAGEHRGAARHLALRLGRPLPRLPRLPDRLPHAGDAGAGRAPERARAPVRRLRRLHRRLQQPGADHARRGLVSGRPRRQERTWCWWCRRPCWPAAAPTTPRRRCWPRCGAWVSPTWSPSAPFERALREAALAAASAGREAAPGDAERRPTAAPPAELAEPRAADRALVPGDRQPHRTALPVAGAPSGAVRLPLGSGAGHLRATGRSRTSSRAPASARRCSVHDQNGRDRRARPAPRPARAEYLAPEVIRQAVMVRLTGHGGDGSAAEPGAAGDGRRRRDGGSRAGRDARRGAGEPRPRRRRSRRRCSRSPA